MPGWHERTLELQRQGKVQMLGLIQEQHPDRCRLFMQWQQMDWPIMVDSLNLMEVTAVPITLLIDEQGIIRSLRPRENDLAEFLNSPAPVQTGATAASPVRPDLARLEKNAEGGSTPALRELGHGLVNWAESSRLAQAIAAYQRVLSLEPKDGPTHFRLGVAYRKRYDSAHRQAEDFRHAIEHWEIALKIDPNQYIWRRRIQQYGPRLDKPYSFYDWVHQAREAIRSRGEEPAPLAVEPSGAEFAYPAKEIEKSGVQAEEPDPEGRIHRDERPFIQIEPTVVATTGSGGSAVRVHLVFRPNEKVKAHWNNEVGLLAVWLEPPADWSIDSPYHTVPSPPQPVSEESRKIEFEIKGANTAPAGVVKIPGYALYYVCEDVDGTCLYRRQDFAIPLLLRGN